MSTTKISLSVIKVASPCTASWDAMSGDDRTRFCGQCAQYVYNLSEMTRDEAEALILENEGKLCVRYYKRADGTVMTKDCPVGWRAIQRRMLLIGGAAGAVFVAAFGILTFGVFAASVRGNGRGGIEFVNPVARLWNAMFGPNENIQGGIGPRGGFQGEHGVPPVVMGDICPPRDLPFPIVEPDLPGLPPIGEPGQ